MSETNEPIIELAGVRRSYRMGDSILEVLRGIDWRVKRGEWACLLGASGSGKTTLLNLIGALEKPDAGMIRVAGTDLAGLSRRAAAKFRNRRIGFVFQAYHLLPELTILENVMLPARFAGVAKRAARERAESLLATVGLSGRLRHRDPVQTPSGTERRCRCADSRCTWSRRTAIPSPAERSAPEARRRRRSPRSPENRTLLPE